MAGRPWTSSACRPNSTTGPKRIPRPSVKPSQQDARSTSRSSSPTPTAHRRLLDEVLQAEQVERLPGAHCYEFFATSAAFAAMSEAEPGTFYLTDFLVRTFRQAGSSQDSASTVTPNWPGILPQLPQARLPGAGCGPGTCARSSVLLHSDWALNTKNISPAMATSQPASRPWPPAANIRCRGRRLHGVVDRDLVA